MPIRPSERARYPAHWAEIRGRVLARARDRDVPSELPIRCECTGECGHRHDLEFGAVSHRCEAIQYEPHPVTGSRVVITVAHLDHTPENCDLDNLRAMCQRCHLAYDHEHHQRTARQTHRARKAMRDLFDSDGDGVQD